MQLSSAHSAAATMLHCLHVLYTTVLLYSTNTDWCPFHIGLLKIYIWLTWTKYCTCCGSHWQKAYTKCQNLQIQHRGWRKKFFIKLCNVHLIFFFLSKERPLKRRSREFTLGRPDGETAPWGLSMWRHPAPWGLNLLNSVGSTRGKNDKQEELQNNVTNTPG